jgi:pyruvate/2-oxoglutarate dehydrogenase complex dihydrolipoamide dehydrogenase (E3) component
VPSKSLLAAATRAAEARGAASLGVDVGEVRVDFGAVMRHVRAAIDEIAPTDAPEALESAGVVVAQGEVVFTGPAAASVGAAPVRFRQALVATGGGPAVPPIPGLDQADSLTSNTVWELEDLPDRLTVLGGGNIGCELGQAFARLGSRVTLVEGEERILPREDPDAASLVRAALTADGATVLTGSSVQSVIQDPRRRYAGSVVLTDGREVEHDRLLVAVGRQPRSHGLGLPEAGVDFDDRGYVRVDDRLRTSNPRIWAAGDITGHPQFTHLAGVHGSVAAGNAVLGLRRSVATETVPRVTFTQPEVAAAGVSTAAHGSGVRVFTWKHAHVDRAVAEDDTAGFTRLAVDRRGRLVGATIVGPRAGESLAEVVLAIQQGMGPRDIARAIHAYPTYSDGVWNAAIADVQASLAKPLTARAIGALVIARRGWLQTVDRVRR